jgi:PAS domain S-box-containing protein
LHEGRPGSTGMGPATLPEVGQLSSQENGRESVPADSSPNAGQGTTAAERMLANAAHTLCALKRTLKGDVGQFEKELTYRAGMEMFQCYIVREFGAGEIPEERALLDHLMDVFASDGLGTFDVVAYDPSQTYIEVTCPDSLEAIGYLSHGDTQTKPSCSFICGLLAGVGRHVFGVDDCEGPNEIVVTERSCVSTGESECRFIIGKRSKLEAMGCEVASIRESVSEHSLRLNDEILTRNLDLQNLNLDLERQVRKRTEDLKRSEQNYKSLLNLSPDAVIVCLTDGTIKTMNESASLLLGYVSTEDLESKNISSVLLDGRNAWERCVWLINKEGLLRNHEFDFVKKRGDKIIGEVSARMADMHPERCVFMVVRDITERKLLEARMEDAKEECEFFNDLLSHDIANYMSAAMHFLEKLPSSKGLSEDDKKTLSIVAKDIKGAYELASVVRDLSRAEALDENECQSPIDICGLMDEAVGEAKRIYSGRRMMISVCKHSPTCYVEGSPLLERLFVNLLTNAIKFDTSEEAVIEVTIEPMTHKGTEYWSVRIADQGKGIPDHEKEKVFERYFRGDSGVSGAGLGLHVVRKVARACGGLVWAENRVQGDYTKGTVMVTLLKKVEGNQNNHKH